jgi:transposase
LRWSAAVELFTAEKVAEVPSASTKRCCFCGEKLELIRTVMDSNTGDVIHMFECECGERVWDD